MPPKKDYNKMTTKELLIEILSQKEGLGGAIYTKETKQKEPLSKGASPRLPWQKGG